jgi:hypothetical protein
MALLRRGEKRKKINEGNISSRRYPVPNENIQGTAAIAI